MPCILALLAFAVGMFACLFIAFTVNAYCALLKRVWELQKEEARLRRQPIPVAPWDEKREPGEPRPPLAIPMIPCSFCGGYDAKLTCPYCRAGIGRLQGMK